MLAWFSPPPSLYQPLSSMITILLDAYYNHCLNNSTSFTSIGSNMGSLPSPLPQPPSPENSTSEYLVCVSFCSRAPASSESNSSNWIECYNPSDNTWHCIGTIPGLPGDHVLKDFAMVAVRGSIYIIGGRLCLKKGGGDDDEVVELDREVLPNVWRYNVINDEWCQCAPLGTPRFEFACTVSEDKIYVAGGQCKIGNARGISSAEVYDPALDEWTKLPNMSTLRYKCVGVTWQGKIYVVGGFAEREDSDRSLLFREEMSSAEVFDTWRGVWDLKQGMWKLEVPPNQIVAVDDKLYSSGDCLNTWKGHVESYDGKVNIWKVVDRSNLRDFSSPFATSDSTDTIEPVIQRIYLTMAPIGTQLYFLAGYRLPGELFRFMSAVHTFNTSAGDAWRSFEPKEEERDKELCGHCCVVQVSKPS